MMILDGGFKKKREKKIGWQYLANRYIVYLYSTLSLPEPLQKEEKHNPLPRPFPDPPLSPE